MCEEAKIPGKKTNHSLRRMAITTLVHSGVDPTIVQQLSGHKKIESINNYSTASIPQQKNMSGIITDFTTGGDDQTNQDDNEEKAVIRSQEFVENILNEITMYENLHLDNIQLASTSTDKTPQIPAVYFPNHMSPNQNTFKKSLTVFNSQSVPSGIHRSGFPFSDYLNSILAGASISGNVTINMNTRKGRKRSSAEAHISDSENE